MYVSTLFPFYFPFNSYAHVSAYAFPTSRETTTRHKTNHKRGNPYKLLLRAAWRVYTFVKVKGRQSQLLQVTAEGAVLGGLG